MNARRGKTKEGFLYVKQPSRFGKAWKRKWVVIRPNTTKGSEKASVVLELYLEKGAYNKTVNSLFIEGISSVRRVISKSHPRAFEFVKASSEVIALTLAGENETDTQEWIEVFRKLLLPAAENKELNSIQGYGKDIIRLSVVPNKDSTRLKLSGHYLAGVSRLQVTLHNPVTGEKVLDWDLRHIKRFMLPSKGPQHDLEKIACLQISNRSPQGEGEYLFFSLKAKQFVESIYERLSVAITVKERRSRTSSMLFEIPPKELEQLAKAIQDGGDPGFVMVGADGSIEEDAFESEEHRENGDAKPNGDAGSSTNGSVDVKTNGDAKENHNGETKVEESKVNGNSEDQPDTGDSNKQDKDESLVIKPATDTQDGEKQEGNIPNEQIAAEEKSANGISEDAKAENSSANETNTVSEENESTSELNESSVESAQTVSETEEKVNGSQNETTQATGEILDESTKEEIPEKQDVSTEPIDADEEEAELSESASDVAPRMPPDAAELEEENKSSQNKETPSQEAERTESTNDSVNEVPSEQNGAQNVDSGDSKVDAANAGEQKADPKAEESPKEEESLKEEESTPTPEVETQEQVKMDATEETNQESVDEGNDKPDTTTLPVKEEPSDSKEEDNPDQTVATDKATVEEDKDKSPEPVASTEVDAKVPAEESSIIESADSSESQEKQPEQEQVVPPTEETDSPAEEPTQAADTNDTPEDQQMAPSVDETENHAEQPAQPADTSDSPRQEDQQQVMPSTEDAEKPFEEPTQTAETIVTSPQEEQQITPSNEEPEKPAEDPTQPIETSDSPKQDQVTSSTDETDKPAEESEPPSTGDSKDVGVTSKVEVQSEGQEKVSEKEVESTNEIEEDTNL